MPKIKNQDLINLVTKRALLYSKIREFFKTKNIIEVETPILSPATVTDPYINSFEIAGSGVKNKLYLQTSPEFAMKRLLCSGIGSIFQICKVFRAEEIGRNHNIEFTMLEWYCLEFNLDNLMDQMAELLKLLLGAKFSSDIIKFKYRDLFFKYLNFDYNLVDIGFLKNKIVEIFPRQFDAIIYDLDFDRFYNKDDLLMILLSNYIEPILATTEHNKIIFLYDYPSTQAALAQVDYSYEYPVAKRFEVYCNGLELANGFYELGSHEEQLARFNADLQKRKMQNLPDVNIDYKLIDALKLGLPKCSGVALGLDRVLMLQTGAENIEDVLVFRS